MHQRFYKIARSEWRYLNKYIIIIAVMQKIYSYTCNLFELSCAYDSITFNSVADPTTLPFINKENKSSLKEHRLWIEALVKRSYKT